LFLIKGFVFASFSHKNAKQIQNITPVLLMFNYYWQMVWKN